jgi:ParB family chromosome partitioning protein
MKSNRLGRGLEALIPLTAENEPAPVGAGPLSQLDVSSIRVNPLQPRTEFDRDGLEDLKRSIQENGVIQPITVRKVDGGWEVVAGERRLRAVRELSIPRIPVYEIQVDSDDKMLELALVENVQRENLNPIELAKAYVRLQKEYGLTQETVAQKVGKDRATVANVIRLLKLPEEIQASIEKGDITMGHARALTALDQRGEQLRMWKLIIQKGLNVRQIEEAVRAKTNPPAKSTKTEPRKTPQLAEIEDRLRSALGTQVRVSQSGSGGKIEIVYFSGDDLERILEVIQSGGASR